MVGRQVPLHGIRHQARVVERHSVDLRQEGIDADHVRRQERGGREQSVREQPLPRGEVGHLQGVF